VLVVGIDEDRLEHAGRRNEIHEVRFGYRATECPGALADAQVLPVVALTQNGKCGVVGHGVVSLAGGMGTCGALPATTSSICCSDSPASRNTSRVCSPRRGGMVSPSALP